MNTHINVVEVKAFQPPACKVCWGRRAVNSVTVGPSHPYSIPLCQPCTNRVITNWSGTLNVGTPTLKAAK